MTRTEQLDQLFGEWENTVPAYRGKFVRDGIINEEEWDKSDTKILFVAKEPNHGDVPKAGDFREEWRNGFIDYAFAYRVAEWAFGILNEFPPFDDFYHEMQGWKERYTAMLLRIAFMNVRKMGGGRNANHEIVGSHIQTERGFLLKQIEIINPEIIICSLVDINLVQALFGKEFEFKKAGYVRHVFKWNNCRVVDFYHPSSLNVPAASYSLLQNIMNSETFKEL